ncbi:unnamed protein product, partial [Ectocarpus sp. 12 AP-2014]
PSLTYTQSQTTSTNIDHHRRRQVTSSVHPSTPNSVLSVLTQNFLDDTTSGFEVSPYTNRQEELSKNLPPPTNKRIRRWGWGSNAIEAEEQIERGASGGRGEDWSDVRRFQHRTLHISLSYPPVPHRPEQTT